LNDESNIVKSYILIMWLIFFVKSFAIPDHSPRQVR